MTVVGRLPCTDAERICTCSDCTVPVTCSVTWGLLQAMFGWVGDHTSGLFADEQEVIDDADMSGEKKIEDKYARQSGEDTLHCVPMQPGSLCI